MSTLTLQAVLKLSEEINEIVESNNACNARIVGSLAVNGFVVGESDVDILVDRTARMNGFDLGRILVRVSKLLKRPVDVLLSDNLRPEYRESILADVVELTHERSARH